MHVAGIRRRTSACLVAIASAALLASSPARADDCPFADSTPGTATADQIAQATVCLLNERRTSAGLDPLSQSAPLTDTAATYAAYMVSTDHFAHLDESGHNVVFRVLQTDPALAGQWTVIGENLGWGSSGLASPRAMVAGWMASPAHRDNVLFPGYDQIGVGTAQGAPTPGVTDPALTYATVFGQITPPDPAGAAGSTPAPKHHARHRRSKARAARHHRRRQRQSPRA